MFSFGFAHILFDGPSLAMFMISASTICLILACFFGSRIGIENNKDHALAERTVIQFCLNAGALGSAFVFSEAF
jgi:hypothetical protein